MTEIKVRLLVDDEWQLYRDARLAALRDAPQASIARFEDEASYDDDFWRKRIAAQPASWPSAETSWLVWSV